MTTSAPASTIDEATRDAVRAELLTANEHVRTTYPGEASGRQPVHTLYGGAQLYKRGAGQRMGQLALRSLDTYAPDADTLADALGIERELMATVYPRVRAKLEREAVEDFRIDFEDGFGVRTDAEEDEHAVRCAVELAADTAAGTAPPFIGIRIKPFTDEAFPRSARTLDLFLSALLDATDNTLPPGFVVTLPKVTHAEHVRALDTLLAAVEATRSLAGGTIPLEIMVETPQSVIAPDGSCALPALVDAGNGRCRGAHFGTYDYTALRNITAAFQQMDHAACDFAREQMQVSLAGRGLMLSDGATNVLPVGPNVARDGEPLGPVALAENRETVHRAWRLAHEHTRHSLEQGMYQGWDLHPAQLPIRYATVYAFFLEGRDQASERLRGFLGKAAQATLTGDVFDDAATGQGLLNFFLRGIACGALDEQDAEAAGITMEDLADRSFMSIVARHTTRT